MNFKSFAVCDINNEVYNQGLKVAQSEAYKDCKIRLMPDGHVGATGPIGFVCEFTDKIVPGTVGVDIACRVTGYNLGPLSNVDVQKLDEICNNAIPTGFDVRKKEDLMSFAFPYEKLYCWDALKNHDRLRKSMGTLGGGNHYLELDYDENTGDYWFVIHCGSRNLGKQVAEYYQNLAIQARQARIDKYNKTRQMVIARARARYHSDEYTQYQLGKAIEGANGIYCELVESEPANDLCYIEGEDMAHYLNDMKICNDFSLSSHNVIFFEIMSQMGWKKHKTIVSCIHNYVDVEHGIIRKGAIEGYRGQLGLIPLNMRDGILLVQAKGNEDWNYSLPHGAGRLMSRGKARREVSLADFQEAMKGIYSTSIGQNTLDESPMAYKDAQQIIEAIQPNADIISHMRPVWNMKAH